MIVGIVSVVVGTVLARRSFALSPKTAARDAVIFAAGLAVWSAIPLAGALAAVFVPYLVGLEIHAGQYGNFRWRAAFVTVAVIVAVIAEGVWAIASQGL